MREDSNRTWHDSPEYRQEQFSAALDGMLTPDEQTTLDAHLAGCETCPRELEEMRQVRMLLHALPKPALPRSFLLPLTNEPSATPAPVIPLRQPPRPTSRMLQVTRWIGTVAAVLGLALFLGSLLTGLTHQAVNYSSSAPSSASNGGAKVPDAAEATPVGTRPAPTQNLENGGSVDQRATASATTKTPTLAVTSTPTAMAQVAEPTPGPSSGDILRVVALALLLGGIVLALASLLLARVM